MIGQLKQGGPGRVRRFPSVVTSPNAGRASVRERRWKSGKVEKREIGKAGNKQKTKSGLKVGTALRSGPLSENRKSGKSENDDGGGAACPQAAGMIDPH